MMLAYERRGDGSPLVLLHGLGHRRQGWDAVLPLLAATHDVIAVDLPGFGESPPATGARWREDLAPALAAFFDELGLERPHVAGNSLGGALALELAVAGAVSSATALSPAGFWTTWERRSALAVIRSLRAASFLPVPVLRTVLRSALGRALAYGAFVSRTSTLSADAVLGDALAMRAPLAFPPVARNGRAYALTGVPRCPVTVAWGTHDRLLPHRQSLRARERLPEARHVDLPGCGHVPMSDDPDLVAAVILQTTGGEHRP